MTAAVSAVQAMPSGLCFGVESGDEHDRRLHRDVDRERDEREADQTQRATLAIVAGAGQFPQHDCARADLDEAVETESGECDRPSADGREREHDRRRRCSTRA